MNKTLVEIILIFISYNMLIYFVQKNSLSKSKKAFLKNKLEEFKKSNPSEYDLKYFYKENNVNFVRETLKKLMVFLMFIPILFILPAKLGELNNQTLLSFDLPAINNSLNLILYLFLTNIAYMKSLIDIKKDKKKIFIFIILFIVSNCLYIYASLFIKGLWILYINVSILTRETIKLVKMTQ